MKRYALVNARGVIVRTGLTFGEAEFEIWVSESQGLFLHMIEVMQS